MVHYKKLVPVNRKLVPETRNKNNVLPASYYWTYLLKLPPSVIPEKEQVLGMIRAALDSNDQYYKHNPDPNPRVDYKAVEEVGRTLGSAQADRYVKTQVPQDISQ